MVRLRSDVQLFWFISIHFFIIFIDFLIHSLFIEVLLKPNKKVINPINNQFEWIRKKNSNESLCFSLNLIV